MSAVLPAAPARPAERGAQSPFRRIASDFLANPVAVFGLGLLALIVAAALFAPLISPQNPYDLAQLDVMDSKLPPGSESPSGGTFWLGTDDQGRDMLSAIFYGLRISLMVGATSTVLALIIGLTMGLTAAYFGGRIETLIMRIVDIQLSFPAILIALILIAVLGQGTGKVITALVTDPVGVLRAHGAQRGAGREAQGIHGGGPLPRAVAGAHRVPAPAAQLPAADDRRRDRAGGRGDRARGDAVVPGPRACRSPSLRSAC